MNDKLLGYCVFGGALIGALFGSIGAGVVGLGFGALVGAAIGWFAAAAVMERQQQQEEKK